MKKIHFDLLMILLMAVMLLIFSELNLFEEYTTFGMIPLLAFYWLGQFSERRYKKK